MTTAGTHGGPGEADPGTVAPSPVEQVAGRPLRALAPPVGAAEAGEAGAEVEAHEVHGGDVAESDRLVAMAGGADDAFAATAGEAELAEDSEPAPARRVNLHAPDSPVSDESLEAAAAQVADFWRVVQKRAPREVNRRVRLVMESIFRVVHAEVDNLADRLHLARELEAIAAELRGRRPFVAQFYAQGRLAVVRAWDPIKIRGAVDHRRVAAQFVRYLDRADKAVERLNYFLGRAGLDTGPKVEKKPWEGAYAAFEEYRELLWGRVRQDIL